MQMPISAEAKIEIPPMQVQPGDDPEVCLQCDCSAGCTLIFPRCQTGRVFM
jgi:hypothetical protein